MKEEKKTKTAPSAPVTQEKVPEKAQIPPTDMDWGNEETTGFEGTRPEDMGIPFIALLQKGSPEVDQDHVDYGTRGIEGAQAGMVCNTVSRKLVYEKKEDEPMLFVPAYHEKLFQEWKTRESGGGFVQSHRSAVILTKTSRNDKNQDVLPNGNLIITTSYFSGFVWIENEWVRCILPMTSTQLKKARSWLNMMHGLRINGKMPPMYSHVYAMTTVKEQNEKGTWWGWKITVYSALRQADMQLITDCRQIALESSDQKSLAAPANSGESDDSVM